MDFEKIVEQQIQKNEELMNMFEEYMKNLSEKVRNKHMDNIALFLNDFLVHYEIKTYKDGVNLIDSFFISFFIPKCWNATAYTVKEYSSSIRKFYKCMLLNNKISEQEYNEVCQTIKNSLSEWIEMCEG